MLNPACDNCAKVLLPLGDGDIEPLHQGQYPNNEKKRMKKHKGGWMGVEAEASGHGPPMVGDGLGDSEGRQVVSWIWRSPGVLAGSAGMMVLFISTG